jgi:ArsR family transcriptional regulator, arsenate/arsenite/antimonite-responsive transcriptional repressor
MEYNTVEVLKAISDPIRLSIIKKLYSKDELCACDILDDFKITQPTLSFHMKKLTQCGLVSSRKDGTWVRYKVNNEYYNRLVDELNIISRVEEERCKDNNCGVCTI